MKNLGYFILGFIKVAATYAIPLWVMHTYFKATDTELCYVLITTQALLSIYTAIERADRHDAVFKWIAIVTLSVAFNAMLLYLMVKLFGSYPAVVGYILIKASYAGKDLLARKRYERIMLHMHSLLGGASEKV